MSNQQTITDMTRLTLFILLSLLAGALQAQIQISGTVIDKKGEPIIGTNVMVVGSYDGASTDINGYFSFETYEEGANELQVSFIGYKNTTSAVEIDGKPIVINLVLEEAINKLNAVVITAGSFNASEDGNREVLKALDIATTAGATADISGALNTLPGTQKVGESGRLFVRGGAGYETKTFIDGMAVLNAYSPSAPSTPSRGRFSPFMFKGTSFSTGGYSAEYGEALSSALILDTKDIESVDRGDIAIMTVGGSYAHNKSWEKSSLSAKVEYIDISPYIGLVRQKIEWLEAPKTISANYAYRIKTSKTGMLKVYGNLDQSSFQMKRPTIDDENIKDAIDLKNDYQYINTNYKEILNDIWLVRGGVSFTSQHEDIVVNGIQVDQVDQGIHAKVVLEHELSDQVSLSFGTEVLTNEFTENVIENQQPLADLSYYQVLNASFVESEQYWSNNLATKVGVRSTYSKLINSWQLDPRVSLAYKTSENGQMSLAYGQFHQDAQSQWLKINDQIKPEKATHYILNYQVVKNKRTFRIEGYFKQYEDLIKFDEMDLYNPNSYSNNGNGVAKGIDVFWRDNKSLKGTDYWISYSYLDTERDYLTFSQSSVPSFASKHNVSVVYKKFFQSIKSMIGATYSYTSGRYYHNPNFEGFQNSQTKAYQDLSFNISYLMRSNVIIHGSVTNVLGFKNVFGYEYGEVQNSEGLFNERAITQPAPRFLFLGIFITLAKDKTMNQMPNL